MYKTWYILKKKQDYYFFNTKVNICITFILLFLNTYLNNFKIYNIKITVIN